MNNNEPTEMDNTALYFGITLGKTIALLFMIIVLVFLKTSDFAYKEYAVFATGVFILPTIAVMDRMMYANLLMGLGFALGLVLLQPFLVKGLQS
jgi:hypothetical protein